VVLTVTLDAQGRATDTTVLSEEPREVGFGAAASTVAHTMTYRNPTGQPAQLEFMVKFALVPAQESEAAQSKSAT
jgi:hypothetical protein